MSGDVHVRICERLGVRLPRATRLLACFTQEDDARRFLTELTDRLAQFNLAVEPTKTRLLRFGDQARAQCKHDECRRPPTFIFLGLTHFDGRSRRDRFVVGRKTQRERLCKKLRALNVRLSDLRTHGGKALLEYVVRHLQGHIQYYGVSGNFRSVQRYLHFARRLLFKWLNRRSQRRSVTWARFHRGVDPPLPRVRIVHSLYSTPPWKTQTGSRMV